MAAMNKRGSPVHWLTVPTGVGGARSANGTTHEKWMCCTTANEFSVQLLQLNHMFIQPPPDQCSYTKQATLSQFLSHCYSSRSRTVVPYGHRESGACAAVFLVLLIGLSECSQLPCDMQNADLIALETSGGGREGSKMIEDQGSHCGCLSISFFWYKWRCDTFIFTVAHFSEQGNKQKHKTETHEKRRLNLNPRNKKIADNKYKWVATLLCGLNAMVIICILTISAVMAEFNMLHVLH